MGFDLFGIAPKETEKPELLNKVDKNWGTEYGKLTKEEKEQYHNEHEKWSDNNPGTYFRNNVWWWRPLWGLVCEICDSILTPQDMEEGCMNGGHRIDVDKALDMHLLLEEGLKDGSIKNYIDDYIAHQDQLPDEECNICDGKGNRSLKGTLDLEWNTIQDDTIQECRGCEGTGFREAFAKHYPLNIDNVKEFSKFCKLSGGFEIC